MVRLLQNHISGALFLEKSEFVVQKCEQSHSNIEINTYAARAVFSFSKKIYIENKHWNSG